MATKGRRSAFALVFVAAALLLGGCDLVTGGGWIPSAVDPSAKATFGFVAHCRLEDFSSELDYWFYEGQLEYRDKAAGVSFHADISPFIGVVPGTDINSCEAAAQAIIDLGADPTKAEFRGTYRQQPGGGTGDVVVDVQDLGEPGGASGDNICVSLSGGPLDGYKNCGILQGGNIHVQ